MARPLRIQYPGAVYHVTCRGNEQKDIFKDDADRKLFLQILPPDTCDLKVTTFKDRYGIEPEAVPGLKK